MAIKARANARQRPFMLNRQNAMAAPLATTTPANGESKYQRDSVSPMTSIHKANASTKDVATHAAASTTKPVATRNSNSPEPA